ncbi:hypothetical protein GLOIN_2v1488974 [Rhizophagus clarus]|uniref:Uncharacterized protein n=1 Tax=Rhizophagus clarus TaxID=94130 RepID=A0A8H3QLC7_9GLOM|nr:hypothetical protein GLOIN_2v1488974 [Rhizophagus clarus]
MYITSRKKKFNDDNDLKNFEREIIDWSNDFVAQFFPSGLQLPKFHMSWTACMLEIQAKALQQLMLDKQKGAKCLIHFNRDLASKKNFDHEKFIKLFKNCDQPIIEAAHTQANREVNQLKLIIRAICDLGRRLDERLLIIAEIYDNFSVF